MENSNIFTNFFPEKNLVIFLGKSKLQNSNIFMSFSFQIFLTIFLVKSKLSTDKKPKTTTFSQVFHPKKWQFSREIKLEFWDKKWRFRTVWIVKLHFWTLYLAWTEGRFGMVTSNIVELDSISIKVVQNGHTEFVTHTVIRLRTTISEIKI